MRVCFVVESGTDVRLVDGLWEHFDITVIARQILGGVEVNRRPKDAVPIHVGPASRARFALHVLRYLRRTRKTVDRVIVQGYGPAALAANVASRMTRTPTYMLVCSPVELYYLCRMEHGIAGKRFRPYELRSLAMFARANARLGHHYIVLSEHLGDVVRGHGTKRPVSVIPVYGVDTNLFRPTVEPKSVLRSRLDLPERGEIVFFSSRIAPEKDGESLLEATRMLRDRGRDIRLLNLSGGHCDFTHAAQDAGVADRVIARDAVHPTAELPAFYQASDLCVQASREEGLGFSPLEALACGTPVVAAAVGGLRETIVHGETGWSYPPGDAAALAACMEEALDNRSEAARRADAGRAMVANRFERHVVFDRLAELLQSEGI